MLGKEVAAREAVTYLVPLIQKHLRRDGRVVLGVGTGSTVAKVMQGLGEALGPSLSSSSAPPLDPPTQIIGIPSSYQASQLILSNNWTLGSLLQYPRIDLGFDGADEVDLSARYLIKGGGGAHFMEKCVAFASAQWIVIVDESKVNPQQGVLGVKWSGGIPLSVHPETASLVKQALSLLGFACEERDSSKGKIGPVFSDQGHLLLDLTSTGPFTALESLEMRLQGLPGILAHGLFIDRASTLIIGHEDGSCRLLHPRNQGKA